MESDASDEHQIHREQGLPWLESRRACGSRANYRMHSHPTLSIGAVDAGKSLLRTAHPEPLELSAGSVVFLPPGAGHSCNPAAGIWSYQMLHIDAEWISELQREELAEWVFQDLPWVSANPDTYRRFCALNELVFSGTDLEEKQAQVICFLSEELSELEAISAGRSVDEFRALSSAFLAAGRMLSLKEMADLAGISRFQLIRIFKAATGLTPIAWQTANRVSEARSALAAGEEVADVAHRLGFADQAHLTRVFKAHTATTPGRYRD